MQGWQGVGGRGPSLFKQLGWPPLCILDSLLPPCGCKVGDATWLRVCGSECVCVPLGAVGPSKTGAGAQIHLYHLFLSNRVSLLLSTRCGLLEHRQAAVAYQETESEIWGDIHLQWVRKEGLDMKVSIAESSLIMGTRVFY